MTRTNAERLSDELPVNAGAATVPAGVNELVPLVPAAVSVWVCPDIADPANTGCVKVPAPIVGGFAGHATVPSGVMLTDELWPSGVIVVELSVPVTAEVAFDPVAATVCVCPASALPAKVGCVNVPDAIVGVETGHAIVGCVKLPAAIVGTPPGQEIAPSANAPLALVGTPAGQEIVG